jgi:tRNA U34 5-methylaminomethyl-2-thiouridine-forming methyltransferase MnmC
MTIIQADHVNTQGTLNPGNSVQTAITRDGSPTLLDFSRDASGTGESMHSLSGAVSESIYVYGPALEHHLNNTESKCETGVCIGIVGLGLGYLEMITAALLLRYVKQRPEQSLINAHICSFESNAQLVSGITNWLAGFGEPLYDQVCEHVARTIPDVNTDEIKSLLRKLRQTGQWTVLGRLDGSFTKEQRIELGMGAFDVIFYDAYSPASSPELWQRDFLGSFLSNHARNYGAVFASYASRTSLKQSLRDQGFILEPRRGFGSKRECTLAFRPGSVNLLEL